MGNRLYVHVSERRPRDNSPIDHHKKQRLYL